MLTSTKHTWHSGEIAAQRQLECIDARQADQDTSTALESKTLAGSNGNRFGHIGKHFECSTSRCCCSQHVPVCSASCTIHHPLATQAGCQGLRSTSLSIELSKPNKSASIILSSFSDIPVSHQGSSPELCGLRSILTGGRSSKLWPR